MKKPRWTEIDYPAGYVSNALGMWRLAPQQQYVTEFFNGQIITRWNLVLRSTGLLNATRLSVGRRIQSSLNIYTHTV